MKNCLPIARVAAVFALILADLCLAYGQVPISALPAIHPTSSRPDAASPQNAPSTSTKDVAPRSRITWEHGTLTVEAENASLNQILREISRRTGMKITGGVSDERVYGKYGPDSPEAVLIGLLTGTGSNILFKEEALSRPMELILSPRRGGASPPSPASFEEQDQPQPQEDQTPPTPFAAKRAQIQRYDPPPDPASPATPDQPGDSQPIATPAADTTADQQNPTGPKSPQQIYDQLVKIQQQRGAAAAQPR